ncbi:MAG: GTPase ObgE [Clostridiales bacterium]|nr:GTPase ObgE [Clostridiales bacterium]
MILDKIKIHVKAGDGGNGAVSFRREKYVSHGGPDGGDGGRGGNIVIRIDKSLSSLIDYKYKRIFKAGNGAKGGAKKLHGASAPDVILRVPQGTIIRDAESELIIADMTNADDLIICRGGNGGWGNVRFATPTRQAPRFAKSGIQGEEREIILELKMIADVGLIGLPNAGKSSLLNKISAARPKIASYKFTTLTPILGVVTHPKESSRTAVAADIPGLISGASEGAGLGFEFLRHIERCRLFIHVVDASGEDGDPLENLKTINNELRNYDSSLLERPQIIAANKCDILAEDTDTTQIEAYAAKNNCGFARISAETGEGCEELVGLMFDKLEKLPAIKIYEPEIDPCDNAADRDDRYIEITNVDGTYVVESEWLLRLMRDINFDEKESLMYFQRVLRTSGVIEALEEKGCKNGDTVSIYDFEFDFVS